MGINNRIKAFVGLGNLLREFSVGANGHPDSLHFEGLEELISRAHIQNPWFTPDNVRFAIGEIGEQLREEQLVEWLSSYITRLENKRVPRTVAVIMAGNVPMAGFHDMLCVLVSGHKFLGKLSSDDKLLLPLMSQLLISREPAFADMISFTDGQVKGMDAVIATGSNNSARYFEYYFGKYPHIIRRNRNSVAVLNGEETKEELAALGDDIFRYFGLGCRNVSKIFVPENYKFDSFYEAIFSFKEVINNNKYANNYEYNKTVYLMNGDGSLLDNNFLLLREDTGYSSPIGVLFYEYYSDHNALLRRLQQDKELLQCVVSDDERINDAVRFGHAQRPGLADYADGVDTMEFLVQL